MHLDLLRVDELGGGLAHAEDAAAGAAAARLHAAAQAGGKVPAGTDRFQLIPGK